VALEEVREPGAAPPAEQAAAGREARLFTWLLVAGLALCALGWAVTASHQRALEQQLQAAQQQRDAALARLGEARVQSHSLADEASGLAARIEALDALLGGDQEPQQAR